MKLWSRFGIFCSEQMFSWHRLAPALVQAMPLPKAQPPWVDCRVVREVAHPALLRKPVLPCRCQQPDPAHQLPVNCGRELVLRAKGTLIRVLMWALRTVRRSMPKKTG